MVIRATVAFTLQGVGLHPSTLVTDRLTLTPLVEADAETMVAVLNDERMYEFTGGEPPTLEQLRARYNRLAVGHPSDRSEQWFNWIVRLSDIGRAVGAVQATVAADGSAAEVAWEIGVQWQGHGIASEAAGAVVAWLDRNGVTEVRAFVHPEHQASARVAERIGLAPTDEVVDGEIVWRRPTPPLPP